jgi:hypothetical protein
VYWTNNMGGMWQEVTDNSTTYMLHFHFWYISFYLLSKIEILLYWFFNLKKNFFVVLGLELRAYTLSHSTSPFFCDRVFWDRVSWTICSVWLLTAILLISASWASRVSGVSHQHPAYYTVLYFFSHQNYFHVPNIIWKIWFKISW